MSVARGLRRNKKTTKMTSAMEISSVRSISETEARMVVVRSSTVSITTAAGMEALRDGSAALIRSTVSIMFAPGSRKMISGMDGLPFK